MTCSTALALDDVYGLGYGDSDAGRVTLINAAIKSENEMAGASTGGLDQSASMRCTEGHALLLDCRPELTPLENVSQQEFDLDEYNLELLVVDTQAPHQSTMASTLSVAPPARKPPRFSVWPTCALPPTASPRPMTSSRPSRKRLTPCLMRP